jgi:hypothetical protein
MKIGFSSRLSSWFHRFSSIQIRFPIGLKWNKIWIIKRWKSDFHRDSHHSYTDSHWFQADYSSNSNDPNQDFPSRPSLISTFKMILLPENSIYSHPTFWARANNVYRASFCNLICLRCPSRNVVVHSVRSGFWFQTPITPLHFRVLINLFSLLQSIVSFDHITVRSNIISFRIQSRPLKERRWNCIAADQKIELTSDRTLIQSRPLKERRWT